MRLLKIGGPHITLTNPIWEHDIPPYAILSHAWGKDEPTFEDMQTGKAQSRPGWKKVEYAAQQAFRDGYRYLWVDTVCIDKRDSTELFEAINSMFRWYAEAQVCYAYLVDVHELQDFEHSRWWTRGWTLQEMLAPAHVSFFTSSWQHLGRKTDETLRDPILRASGITPAQQGVLTLFRADDWTIAERMSWASRRTTTRKEDIAYCLLGIFGVHIPLLYGEGERAFFRLQEEIMRVSDDHSLFAWVDKDVIKQAPCGLLARSPAQFSEVIDCDKSIWSASTASDDRDHEPYAMTNQGIHIQLTLVHTTSRDIYFAMLGYGRSLDRPAIVVKRIRRDEFARVHANELFHGKNLPKIRGKGRLHRLTFKQRTPVLKSLNLKPSPMYWLDFSGLVAEGISLVDVIPRDTWNANRSIIQPKSPEESSTVVFQYIHRGYGAVQFKLVIDANGRPFLHPVYPNPRPERQSIHFNLRWGPSPMESTGTFMSSSGVSDNYIFIRVRSLMETAVSNNKHGQLFSVRLTATRSQVAFGTEGRFVSRFTVVLGASTTFFYLYARFHHLARYCLLDRKQTQIRLFNIFTWLVTYLPAAILPIIWAYVGGRNGLITFRRQALQLIRALQLHFLAKWVEAGGGDAIADMEIIGDKLFFLFR